MASSETIDELWELAETEADPAHLLVLADALEEAGDPLAAGIRWIGENARRPWQSGQDWWWGVPDGEHSIPDLANRRMLGTRGGPDPQSTKAGHPRHYRQPTFRKALELGALCLIEAEVV